LSRGLEGEGGSYIFMQLINYGSRKGFGKKKRGEINDFLSIEEYSGSNNQARPKQQAQFKQPSAVFFDQYSS
jgi:hypothetical protein